MHPVIRTSALSVAFCFVASLPAEILPPGHEPESIGSHILRASRVVVRPGEVVEGGAVLIRAGRIEAVGADIQPPEDARVWDLAGATIYAGLIDPYLTLKPATNVLGFQSFESHADEPMASGFNFFGISGQEKDQGNPGPGYKLSQVTPERRMADSFTLDEKSLNELRELGFTAGNLAPDRGVVRGASAFVTLGSDSPNQSILRPAVFQHIGFEVTSPREDAFPRSLMGAIAAVRQAFFDAQHYGATEDDREEINVSLEALLPAVRKEMRVVFEPGSVLMVDRAVRVGRELDLDYLILASGQEWRRPDLMKASAARFIVPLQFPEVPRLPEESDWSEVSLDNLRSWDWAAENPALLRQQGLEVALTLYGLSDRKHFRRNLKLAVERGLSESDALAALTTVPAEMCGLEKELGTIEPGKLANLTVVEGSYFAATNKVLDVWVRGRAYRINSASKQAAAAPETPAPEDQTGEKSGPEPGAKRLAKSPQEGRGPLIEPKAVFVRGATIWTSGPDGVIENGDLLVVEGKISAVGKNLQPPADATIIDGSGKHVSAGLIDCHSHAMVVGNVNEFTLPSSALVRIGDVVNSETRRIHEQLAGGLTVANLLHGSANPIGGQNCVIKLKEGAGPEELKFKEAPAGIKFALGENVKQANSETRTTRFPQSRMGVPTFIENRFLAAREYMEEWKNFRSKGGPRPQRNLELEALAEILEGTRLIHCHSYRQDEILVFLRLMESLGIKVATLQHVLEGYKVADEIARHGAGASCFSDWWAYKYEVIDAIPYAGAIMHQRGVSVSFNSDSGDLARRLYTEAAKAVKYGGVRETEALNFVTINAARQLRIDSLVGSLEPGKHGDFVIWSRAPLDSRTQCLQTWIEGKKYFDIEVTAARAEELREERKALVAKAKKAARSSRPQDSSKAAQAAFFHMPFELQHEKEDRHCDSH